jgi:mono/diheme cytochrome c family protein
MSCHGEQGIGGHGGGASLVNVPGHIPVMADTAWNGRNSMPPFRGVLTAEQLRDVLQYVSQDLFKAAP